MSLFILGDIYNMKTKKERKPRKWRKRLLLTFIIFASLGLAGAGIFIYDKLSTLPNVDTQYLETFGTSEILDANGNVIWKPTDKRVGKVTYDEVEKLLYTEALIAVEDENFMTSPGVSARGFANMVYGVLRSKIDSGYVARGGSTIDQQLIKNVYYNGGIGHSTSTRKIQEWWLATQLNLNYEKDEILVFYLNQLQFAEGAQGISAIMKTYFGKSPADYAERTTANIAEQAYLAGLGQAPSGYNLYEHPEEANQRKNVVLGVLLENEIITQAEYDDAKAYDLTTGLKPRFWESEAQRLQNLKYKVYTDEVLREATNLGYNLEDITLTIQSFLVPETFDAITNKVREDQYFQDGVGGTEQVAATVINKDGIVIGMVGSRHSDDELNRATQRTRSSGSSLKPFTAYGPLLQYFGNQYNTSSVFDTNAYLYPGTNVYMHNYGQYTYGTRDIQYALRMSLNTPVARIDDGILGSARMKTFLHGVGLDVNDYYTSVDGIGLNISTLQASAAYNAINNGGVYTEPRFINKIVFTDGSEKVIPAKTTQAMNASTAFVLTQMLRGAVSQGYSAQSAAIPSYAGYAGKTGTVAFDASVNAPNVYGGGGSDSWYNSITNEGYSVSVWFGYDEPNTSPQVADAFEGPQWLGRDLQLMLTGNTPKSNWKQPNTVNTISGSGLNTHYAITDAADIDTSNTAVYVPEIPSLNTTIGELEITPEIKADAKWSEKLQGKEKSLYELYQKDKKVFENTDTLSTELYNLLGGDN